MHASRHAVKFCYDNRIAVLYNAHRLARFGTAFCARAFWAKTSLRLFKQGAEKQLIHHVRHGMINKTLAAQPFKGGKTMQNRKITFWVVILALLKTIGRAAFWILVVFVGIVRALVLDKR